MDGHEGVASGRNNGSQRQAPWRGTLYFDITDLLEYARFNTTLSGIQRVTVLTLGKIFERFDEPRVSLIAFHPLDKSIQSYEATFFRGFVYDQTKFCRAFRLNPQRQVGWGEWSLTEYIARKYGSGVAARFHKSRLRLLNKWGSGRTFKKRGIRVPSSAPSERAGKVARAAMPVAGDTIFVPGATWNFVDFLNYLAECSKHGIHVVQFVHDLIPLIVPEHVVDNVPEQFSDWLSRMAVTADRFIVNSQCTGRDLAAFLREFKFPAKPISVLPLAHEFASGKVADSDYEPPKSFADSYHVAGQIHARVLNAGRLPFALCVGTIESRKNVWTLVRAWIVLSAELRDAMPRLVFAGKHGWLKEDFDELMQATGNVGGLVRIVERPDDNELEYLYRKCRFSICLSYYEGWGLPVGESLWFGRPVLASSTSSIPEVGGAAVDYADPHSLPEILGGLRRLIVDDPYLAEREAGITAMPKRSWLDVADELVDALVGEREAIKE